MPRERTYAVIIGIEDYSFSAPPYDLTALKYAENDAREFKKCISEAFRIEEANLSLFINETATKSRIQNELQSVIKGLAKEDTFIFFYRGGGFHSNNENRITTWDSDPDSLEATTVSLKDALLNSLEYSKCGKTLIFLDGPSPFMDSIHRQEEIYDLKRSEFEEFISLRNNSVFFIASSPGQASYRDDKLKHGIWTNCLLEALRGNAPSALKGGEWVTDETLKNYLSFSVPRFIRENTTIRGNQEPYGVLSEEQTLQIARIHRNDDELLWKELSLDFKNSFLRKEVTGPISSISGFARKRGHFIPDRHSARAGEFLERLLGEDMSSESRDVYDNAKSILHLKRREIDRSTFEGGANVDCDIFRFALSCRQDDLEPSQYVVTRTVSLRVSVDVLPNDFDNIFPVSPDEFIVPITGTLDFDEIADLFEDLSDKWSGRFFEDEDNQLVSIHTNTGTSFGVDLKEREFTIQTNRDRGCLELLQTVSNELKRLIGYRYYDVLPE